jgi:phenylacetate-CoA ligase
LNISLLPYLVSAYLNDGKRDQWTREQIDAYQRNALAALRQHAYQNSPFYQRFHKGLFNAPLHELPVMNRKIMLDNFNDLVTDRTVRLDDVRRHMQQEPGKPFKGKYWVNSTSGTTGVPAVFLYHRREWAQVVIFLMRAYRWAGIRLSPLKKRRMAYVTSTNPWHLSSQVSQTVHLPSITSMRIPANDPLPSVVSRLNEFQPDTLIVYSSMGRILAAEQMAGHLNISPQVIMTSAEVLTPETRQMITDVWGVQPFDQYGTTETAAIGCECTQHNGQHMFEDICIVENVDAQNRPVPVGEFGEKILLTVLFNYSQPLIRYEISDSICVSDKECSCGRKFRLIEKVQGRQEDILYFPNGVGEIVGIHPIVFHNVMDTVRASGWQVVQRDDGLHILLSGSQDNGIQDRLSVSMAQALKLHGVETPPIKVSLVPSIPRLPNGKLRLVLRD